MYLKVNISRFYKITTRNRLKISKLSLLKEFRRFTHSDHNDGSLLLHDEIVDPIVTVSGGPIRGCSRKDVKGHSFLAFEGIPYGEPPIGDLRFKDPIPVKKWKDVKDSTKIGSASLCKQKKVSKNPETGKLVHQWVLEGSEDCLNLNVYTKELKSSKGKLKPVMVFIHGGAYVLGKTKYYGPERLITKDIVLVHFHYRLGAFGFLFVDDPQLEIGNAGMKDKVLALKWVRDNISKFNGDPENVTIFGHSSGAASVGYLTLSPLASGLFHKAIIMSNSALNNVARNKDDNAIKLARALGFEKTGSREILRYLQSLPAEKLYEGQLKLTDMFYPCNFRIFCPSVEPRDRPNAFLNRDPIELLKSGRYSHVPTIIGYTDMECLLFMKVDKESPFNAYCFEEDIITPVWFGFQQGSREFKDIARKIRKFYYGDKEPEFISLPTVEMFSDIGITRGVVMLARYLARTSTQPTYLYEFKLRKNYGEPYESRKINGALHGDDIPYLFKMGKETGKEFERISENLLKLWTDFAKYGNPTPKKDGKISIDWKPATRDELHYLEIGEKLCLKMNPEAERMKFWDNLYQSYPQTEDC